MSWRQHWPQVVRSSVVPGYVISGCRDNDTRTYRLFLNKGWRDVSTGHQIDSCMCCDLSIDDLRNLSSMLEAAIAAHEPWPEDAIK
jgi:hypothetical protein